MPDITDLFAQRATLRRSTSLLTAFRFEQSAPERFYGTLARDTVHLITDLWQQAEGAELRGHTVLDVGGGPGYFASAFADAGARYIGVEPDPREMHATPKDTAAFKTPHDIPARIRDGAAPGRRQRGHLPVLECRRTCVAALAPGRGDVARHPARRAGDLVVHRLAGPVRRPRNGPDALFRGARAARWYTCKHGHPPKNNYGSSLFPVSVRDGLRWARGTGTLTAAFPRYHPKWAWWVTKVPGLREVLVSNLVLVLRPR